MIKDINEIYNFECHYETGMLTLSFDLIKELSVFYSNHYGKWSKNAPQSYSNGKQVYLSPEKLKEWLNNEMSEIWTVRNKNNNELVGYAIALKGETGSKESVIWVTQFVIHKDYRNQGIGKSLLFRVWGFSSFFAWGLLTSNPYAIRALEKMTRRRCEPLCIKKNAQQLLNFGFKNIHYINDKMIKEISNETSKIDTRFFVDHSEIENKLKNITSTEKPWLLGELEEGWEWFAFTFKDQLPIELSNLEIKDMLEASDKMVKDAYNRMPMDNHIWAKFTNIEVDYIISKCNLKSYDKILDVGCGMGRHSLEFSRKGFNNILGIDYAKELINVAIKKAKEESLDVKFKIQDILNTEILENDYDYDCVLCLYDVIGSYTDDNKNKMFLTKISQSLKKGGKAIISVMNFASTEYNAKNKFKLKNSTKELLKLPASNIMEKSGNVFNPDYYLIDTQTNIVYRKEEFSNGNKSPIELIVRDRRFYMDEIVKMCEVENLKVIEKRFVNAGWKNDIEENKAKEILLICEKI